MWVKEGGEVKLRNLSLAGAGGQCLLIPPEIKDGKYPYVLYNFGGSITNLAGDLYLLVLHFWGAISVSEEAMKNSITTVMGVFACNRMMD
jgi:hypothetical protein